MRVQWRAEDSPRTSLSTFERIRRSPRRRSPTASHRESSVDIGVKIKGRATKNTPPRASLKRHSPDRGRRTYTNSNHSPGRHGRGTESFDRHRDQKYHRRERSHQRQPDSELSHPRRRRRTRSPHHKLVSHRDSQRDRSPVFSRYLDRVTSPSRRREAREQSQSSLRADYYAPSREENLTSAGDSYVPTSRRHRSRSPPFELSRDLIRGRRRSRSPRPSSYLKGRGQPSPGGYKPWEDTSSRADLTYDKRLRSQASSPNKSRGPPRHRNPSRALEEETSRTFRKRKSSPSPRALERSSRKNRKMQSSPRPIQSILDDTSRPPSPPRPIPSFNSDSHSSEAVRESFPMHGMKASEVHSMHRPGRPQINTQNSYSTSPQWTPTSSHHGSPQSGSPFSHGRGSWAGQHQQYHGQPK